eukprot:comp17114_c0_seq1/m.15894 comp17114_c0_seq1/g.15894  ORF comp17114_c0_seq1/g.15894 comp17114_c0_seq1/m.15894 type:complete len:122 (-) comp17114_c0_seq1:326-691(-)
MGKPTVAAKAASVPPKVKGRPKSGKVWKEEKQRFSSLVGVKALRKSFAVKQKEREEKARLKAIAKELLEAQKKEKEDKRLRREEQEKRRLENEKKNEIVQKISTSKVKKMSRKQLRTIKKA